MSTTKPVRQCADESLLFAFQDREGAITTTVLVVSYQQLRSPGSLCLLKSPDRYPHSSWKEDVVMSYAKLRVGSNTLEAMLPQCALSLRPPFQDVLLSPWRSRFREVNLNVDLNEYGTVKSEILEPSSKGLPHHAAHLLICSGRSSALRRDHQRTLSEFRGAQTAVVYI